MKHQLIQICILMMLSLIFGRRILEQLTFLYLDSFRFAVHVTDIATALERFREGTKFFVKAMSETEKKEFTVEIDEETFYQLEQDDPLNVSFDRTKVHRRILNPKHIKYNDSCFDVSKKMRVTPRLVVVK